MGIFDDPNMAALAAAAGAFGQGAMPSRMPVPFGAIAGQAAQSAFQGAGQAQQYQKQSIDNQMGQLGLQRAQAMQPNMLAMIKNGFGQPSNGSANSAGSVADQQFGQAYQLAMMSGKMEDAAKVLQSWAEHNPALAGAIETQKADAGIIKDANGNIIRAGNAVRGGNQNPPGLFNPPAVTGDNVNAVSPKGNGGPVNLTRSTDIPMAGDGKPVLPKMTNLFKPDPTGMPKYKTENTETGVNQTKLFQESDSKANDAWANNRNSLTKESAIIDGITKQLANVQPGTTLAQFPDAANRLVGAGLLSKDAANNLSDIQAIRTFLMKDAILQLRDQNANLEGNPSRIMQSELSANLEHGLSTNLQPDALYKVLTQAKGMVNYNKDMIDSYQKLGGLGNRAANGYTLRPNDYAQKFQASHDPSDYIKQAESTTPIFKGMQPDLGSYKSPEDVGAAFKAGKITRDQAKQILQKNHGMQ